MKASEMNDVRAREILSRFPKVQAALPDAYRRIYENEYALNRNGRSLSTMLTGLLESWMHRCVGGGGFGGPILELGAGNLNHVRYESAIDYDVVEPFKALYEDSPNRRHVRKIYNDIADIPSSSRYQRVISIAVLEHLVDLPRVVAQSACLLAKGGVFQAGIPSEGGVLWKLAWRSTTGVGFWMRNRLDYGVVMRHEHVNSAREIEYVLNWLFCKVKIRRFPLPFHSASFYSYLEASEPHQERVDELLERSNASCY